MRVKKELRFQVAHQVLTGKLTINEAMDLCQVKDKRTVVNWAKSFIKEQEKEQSYSISPIKNKQEEIVCYSSEQEIKRLETELANSKNRNLELVRLQGQLNNRINDLEVLISFAEKSYKINIMKIKKKKTF
jgi:hypothetical protein